REEGKEGKRLDCQERSESCLTGKEDPARPGSSGRKESEFFIKECSSGHEDGPSFRTPRKRSLRKISGKDSRGP
uniref:Uncharacterized protein n=1 Tax=Cucumis melo TaxID=3656 RepID=A0A9I9E0P9_CUCME